MNRQRFLPHALIVLTLARFLLLTFSELSPTEAHAALCSQRLECWHPLTGPLLPLLMRPGLAIFGMNEFGVRCLAPLLMLAAGWLVWRVANGLFEGPVSGWAALFFQVTPAVNLAAVTFTNTTLAIFFSALLLALLRLALHRSHKFHVYWWATALAAVLAFYTEWRLFTLSVGGTASLALTRRGRGAMLKWPVMPILVGVGALSLTLFFAWNSEHHWSAFQFFPDSAEMHLTALLWRLLLAFGALLPLFAWALVETALHRPLTYVPAFLYAFTWPLLALDMLTFHTLDWPQAGFCAWVPPVVMLTAHHVLNSEHVSPRLGVWLRSTVLGITALQSFLLLQAGTSPLLRANDSLYGWRTSAKAIREALESEHLLDGRPLHFETDRWQLAAPLSFYLHDLRTTRTGHAFPLVQTAPNAAGRTPENSWMQPPDDAILMPRPDDTVIYITDEDVRHQPRRDLREHRPDWRAIAIFQVVHDGLVQRTLKVFACPPESAAHK
jgi:4-amino-4-deoxy-L-arabinose transferase-like glycosyltransferase